MVSRSAPVSYGKYRLLERIAVGGMAEVFLAQRPGLEGFEKTLAIKRIRPHLSNEDAFLKMFLFEAKLAAQLHHPNISQIYELGRVGDSYFIAMEYISGRDMSRVVPKAERMGIPFPIEYALLIGASALDGLSYAHTKTDDFGEPLNIVHRDVTPENIMVAWNGNVKVLDFGIAKASSQTDHTKAGEIKGKLSYMSPEQSMGKKLDERSDVFTLGVVLYEWISGYKLFTGENEMAVLKAIMDGRIYPPSYFREDTPEGVEAILMKALTKDRDERYQSAREMQYDIQQYLGSGDFVPTNSHLANFMKQLFADEIEREKVNLAEAAKQRQNATPPPLPDTTNTDQAVLGESVGKAKEPSGTSRAAELIVVDSSGPTASLQVNLTPQEFERLKRAAARGDVTVEQMVRELLVPSLKFLG